MLSKENVEIEKAEELGHKKCGFCSLKTLTENRYKCRNTLLQNCLFKMLVTSDFLLD